METQNVARTQQQLHGRTEQSVASGGMDDFIERASPRRADRVDRPPVEEATDDRVIVSRIAAWAAGL